MTFKDRQLNSMTFQAWKIKFLNSMTFKVFYDLYEPCLMNIWAFNTVTFTWYQTNFRPTENFDRNLLHKELFNIFAPYFWLLSVALSSAHAQCATRTNPKWCLFCWVTTNPCNLIVAHTAPVRFSTVPAKNFDLDFGEQNFWTAWRLNFPTESLVPRERNTGPKFVWYRINVA